jgi:uncharacterized protein with PQ loop repeat
MHKWKYWYEKFMLVYACLSPLWILIQAVKIFQTQDSSGVSLASYALVLVGAFFWIIYAAVVLEAKNFVIVANSSVTAVLAVITIIGICLYAAKPVPTVTVTVTVTS